MSSPGTPRTPKKAASRGILRRKVDFNAEAAAWRRRGRARGEIRPQLVWQAPSPAARTDALRMIRAGLPPVASGIVPCLPDPSRPPERDSGRLLCRPTGSRRQSTRFNPQSGVHVEPIRSGQTHRPHSILRRNAKTCSGRSAPCKAKASGMARHGFPCMPTGNTGVLACGFPSRLDAIGGRQPVKP